MTFHFKKKLLILILAFFVSTTIIILYKINFGKSLIIFVKVNQVSEIKIKSTLYKNKNNSVLCMVLTTEENILTRGKAVYETYGSQCDELVFACNCLKILAVRSLMIKEEMNIPVDLEVYKQVVHYPILHVDVIESREKMGEKVLEVLSRSYSVFWNVSSWFFLLDDDAFVFMDNLYKFIETKNTDEPFMYGFHFRHRPLPAGHIAGGSGILLTKESMKRLVDKINKNECNEYIDTFGDVTIGGCGYSCNIQIGNSTDQFGRPKFHFHDPDTHFYGPIPEYLFYFGVHNRKIGKECCSIDTISFHYVKIEKMYEIYSNKNYLRDLLA